MHNFLRSFIFAKNPLYAYLYRKDVARKIPGLKDKPSAVIIENTNLCNISCIFCANEQMKRKRGFIDEDLFQRIIDQCAANDIQTVVIQGFGEPLLDANYPSKIAYAKSKGIKNVYCVTNGILLNKNISEALIAAGLDYLNISIDAASRQVYGDIHRVPSSNLPSDKFTTVIENIDTLIALKKRHNTKKPFIEVRFKDFDKNRADLALFMHKYSGKVDNLIIYMNIANWPGSNIKNNLPKDVPIRFPCYNLWSTLFITYDGRAALCCQDYECRAQTGDANTQDILSIYQSEKLGQMRNLHLQGKFDAINVCSDCVINSHLLSPWWP